MSSDEAKQVCRQQTCSPNIQETIEGDVARREGRARLATIRGGPAGSPLHVSSESGLMVEAEMMTPWAVQSVSRVRDVRR